MSAANPIGEVVEAAFGDLPLVVVGAVARTQRRLCVASYTVPTGRAWTEMCQATERGVDVRLVFCSTTSDTVPPAPFQIRRVQVAGGTMHAKFIVTDDEVLVGSSNFSDRPGSRNVIVRLRGPVVRTFASEFQKLWKLPKGTVLPRGQEANDLVFAAAARQGWTPFLTTVAKRVRTRGYITAAEHRVVQGMIP